MSTSKHIEVLLRKRLAHLKIVEVRSVAYEERLSILPKDLLACVRFLLSDPDILADMLLDITVLDLPSNQGKLEVHHVFRSSRLGYRLRLSTLLDAAMPTLASLAQLYKSAHGLELEAWDMFGVFFEGHGHLRRLILYPEFCGNPLRKDYPIEKAQPLVALLTDAELERLLKGAT